MRKKVKTRCEAIAPCFALRGGERRLFVSFKRGIQIDGLICTSAIFHVLRQHNGKIFVITLGSAALIIAKQRHRNNFSRVHSRCYANQPKSHKHIGGLDYRRRRRVQEGCMCTRVLLFQLSAFSGGFQSAGLILLVRPADYAFSRARVRQRHVLKLYPLGCFGAANPVSLLDAGSAFISRCESYQPCISVASTNVISWSKEGRRSDIAWADG